MNMNKNMKYWNSITESWMYREDLVIVLWRILNLQFVFYADWL